MRTLLLILLTVIPFISFCQTDPESDLPIDPTSHRIYYKLVDTVPGALKKQLYTNAKEWTAKHFNSAMNVIQMDDPAGGKLVIKAFDGYTQMVKKKLVDNKMWFTLTITVKDEKYRVEVTDFDIQFGRDIDKHPAELYIKPSLKVVEWLDVTVCIEGIWKGILGTIKPIMRRSDDF